MQDKTFADYLEQLSSDSPTPGGGSAAAYTTAIAISLALMSINVSKKRKSFLTLPKEEQERVGKVIAWLEKLKAETQEIEKSDALAFNNYLKVYKNENKEEVQKAAFLCYNVPFKLLELNFRVIELIMFLKPYIVKTILSDYKMSLEYCCTNIRCCLINMDINIINITDEDIIKECKETHRIADNTINRINSVLGEI